MSSEHAGRNSVLSQADLCENVARILKALPEPYLILDAEHVEVIFANEPATRYLDDEADGEFGRLGRLSPPGWDKERWENELQSSRTLMTPLEWYASGLESGRWLRLEPALAVSQNCVAFRLRDVTESRELMERREQLRSTMERARRFESAGRIAGALAHEFNNLLAVVLNNADLIAESDSLDEQSREDLQEIRGAATEAAELSRKLLMFGRRDLAKPTFIDVRASIRDLAQRIGDEQSRVITTTFARPVGAVWAHRGQWEAAIAALIDNALQATEEGDRVAVRVDSTTVSADNVHNLVEGEYVVIEVEDEGRGMEEHVAERAFEPFYSTRGDVGDGLGLSIAYNIATSLGGYVEIETMHGSGTTITMLLPSHEDSEAEPTEVEDGSLPVDVTESTILVVEDEPGVLRAVQRILSAHGFNLLTARNGAEALKVVEEFDGEIDLLLTDVVMPGMSGVQLAKKVMRRIESVRVLYMSGYTESALSLDQLVAGKSDLILKPFTATDLLEVIEAHLAQ